MHALELELWVWHCPRHFTDGLIQIWIEREEGDTA